MQNARLPLLALSLLALLPACASPPSPARPEVTLGASGTAPDKDAPPEKGDELAAWVGTYPFEESTTGFGWAYEVRIERTPAGYRAHIVIDGNQESTRVLCTVRPSGPNKVDLLFLSEEEGNVFTQGKPGEVMLGLSRGDDGKVAYRWAKIQSHLTPPPKGADEIGDPNLFVGKDPVDFMAVKPVAARLLALLGKEQDKKLEEYIATQSPITKDRDCLVLDGFYPHSGGSQAARVIYDIAGDKLHVLLYDEDEQRVDVFSERWDAFPAVADEALKEFNKPGFSVKRWKK
jgi:hypothetical protein